MPQPDGRRQVLDTDHHAGESIRLGRVMSGAQLQHHLVLVAEVDALLERALRHAPKVQMMTELAAEQVFGIEPVFDHRGRGPLRGHHRVVPQVPPDVVGEKLRAPVLLPRPEHFEGVVVDQRDTAGPVVAVGATQRRHEDAARPAVHGVRSRVSGLGGQLAGLNGVFQHRVSRFGLGIEHVCRRRPEPGHQQITPS